MKWLISKINNWRGFFSSLWNLIGKPAKAKNFYGHWNYEFAKKYAIKRKNWWPKKFDQKGKDQAILPIGPNSSIVMVVSKLEIKLYKKRSILKHPRSHSKIFKHESYWTTLKS